MGLIVFMVVGLIIGVLVGASMPEDVGGTALTAVAGLTGGLFGGIAGAALGGMDPLTQIFGLWAWVGAIAGAIVVLALYALIATPGTAPARSSGSGDGSTGQRARH